MVATAWRQRSTEDPPPHLDAGIVAAAHRAASATRFRRWRIPAAAAATLVVAVVGILNTTPRPTLVTPPAASDRPLPAVVPAERAAAAPAVESLAAAQPALRTAGPMALAKKATRMEADAAAPVSVDARIAHIHKLHDAGKLVEAARELRALREAVADADQRLPVELREWAAAVRPLP